MRVSMRKSEKYLSHRINSNEFLIVIQMNIVYLPDIISHGLVQIYSFSLTVALSHQGTHMHALSIPISD